MTKKITFLVLTLFIIGSNSFSQSEKFFEIDKQELKKSIGRTYLALEKQMSKKRKEKYDKKDPDYVARQEKNDAAYNAEIKLIIENDWKLKVPVKTISRDELEKMSKEELKRYIIIYYANDDVLRFKNAEMYKEGSSHRYRNNLFSVPLPDFGSRTNGLIFDLEQFNVCLSLAQKKGIYSNNKFFDEVNLKKGSMESKLVLIDQQYLDKKLDADVKSGEFKTEFPLKYKIVDNNEYGVSFDQKNGNDVLLTILPVSYITHKYDTKADEQVNFYGMFFIDSHSYKIIAVKTLGKTKLVGLDNEEKLSPKDFKGLAL